MKRSNANSNNESTDASPTCITSPYYVGGFYVDPAQNTLTKNSVSQNIQPKVMEVLTYLCSKAEQLVSSDELIQTCWPNQYIGDSPVHKCIAQVRKALGDDPKSPSFIKTVPKKGYVFIAKVTGLKQGLTVPLSPKTQDSPYPGLKPYTFAQRELFFGREQVIADINHWLAQVNENDTTWLSITAPVGSGKSSLVNAGILPLFINHSFVDSKTERFFCKIDFALMPRTQKPHLHLLAILLAHEKLSPTLTLENYADLLTTKSIFSNDNEQVSVLASQLLPQAEQGRFILFIDHLEQLFDCYSTIHAEETDLERFFLLLQLLVNSKKCLLITATREQFQSELAQASPDYSAAFHYTLPAFSHTELMDIIQKPAELAGVGFEYNEHTRERLSNEIIKQAHGQSVPISSLQYLLDQLYTKKYNQQLTYKAFDKINGIAGSLAFIAEKNYQQLTEQEQQSFALILFRIITLSTNGQIATSETPCPINHFVDKNKLSVINKFINASIFQLTVVNNHTCVSLAHSSLLTAWPRMNEWIKKHISTLYVRHDLHIATQRWLYHDKSNKLFIYSHNKIKKLNDIIRCNDFEISHDEKALIELSTRHISRTNRVKKAIFTAFFLCFISLIGLSLSLVEKNNQVTTTRDNAENLISFILYDLKDKLEPLGKLELLNIVASKTLDYFELAGTDHLTGKSLIQWVESLHILGDVNISKNNYAEAEAYFKQTLIALTNALHPVEMNESKIKNPEHEKLLELTMLANYWLGYSAYLQLDYKTTLPFWEQYLAYADILALGHSKETWQLEQSYALNNLGALAEKTGDLTSASNYFERSAQIKLALLRNDPDNVTIRTDLADTRSWQSNIHAKEGKLFLAIDDLHQALVQIEKIYTIKSSFKLIERMANMRHKLALLYYDAGELIDAARYSNKAVQNIMKLVNNDKENYRFKKDLLWSYLLSAKIFINLKNLDQALIHQDKARAIIDTFNISLSKTKDIKQANISLLQQQARIMALLKQKKRAFLTITEAITFFEQHFSENTHIELYARIMLTKVRILNTMPNAEITSIKNELNEIKKLLESTLELEKPNYKALSIYLTTLEFMQQLQIDNHLPLNNQWLELYLSSDYNIPDYSIISSMDSQ